MTAFNAVCFCILMDHHKEGVEQAHPGYIIEKLEVFESCSEETALSMLDSQNTARVLSWCANWGVSLPTLS
jgi:hypothetical protein